MSEKEIIEKQRREIEAYQLIIRLQEEELARYRGEEE
jgi:hypothetical protein